MFKEFLRIALEMVGFFTALQTFYYILFEIAGVRLRLQAVNDFVYYHGLIILIFWVFLLVLSRRFFSTTRERFAIIASLLVLDFGLQYQEHVYYNDGIGQMVQSYLQTFLIGCIAIAILAPLSLWFKQKCERSTLSPPSS